MRPSRVRMGASRGGWYVEGKQKRRAGQRAMSYRITLRSQRPDRAFSTRTNTQTLDSYAYAREQAALLAVLLDGHMDGFVTIETDDVSEVFKGQWVEVHQSKWRIGNPNFR